VDDISTIALPSVRRLPRALFAVFRDAGVDTIDVLRAAGVDPSRLGEGELIVSAAEASAILLDALTRVADPSFGLVLGTSIRPELFGVIGLVASSSATYGDALARIARYKRLCTGDRLDIERGRQRVVVRVAMGEGSAAYARQAVDAELSFLLAFGRRMTERPVQALRVTMRGARPANEAPYQRVFGCPIEWGARHDALWLSAEAVALPLVGRNAELNRAVEMIAERLVAAGEDDVLTRVRATIEAALPDGPPPMNALARRLALSPRSLQRKLRDRGTSFSDLISDVRRELAHRHLDDHRVAVAEVSYLLGFSHPNSFYRAFRRWTGMTPDEYRRAR